MVRDIDRSKLKYSASPHAPDWAKDPAKKDMPSERVITSFEKPIPEGPEPEGLTAKATSSRYGVRGGTQGEKDGPFRPTVEQIEAILWEEATSDLRVYALVDGYWAHGLYGRLLASPDLSWAHMYHGHVALNRIQDAPFIIGLKRGHKLTRWLIEEGWGSGWGIFFTASTRRARDYYGTPKVWDKHFLRVNEELVKLGCLVEGDTDPLWVMRAHFRRFGLVEFEDDGRVVFFRYHDPAVLHTYIPSCTNRELLHFFGPVRHYFAEGYCEVESLNRPDLYCRFAARLNIPELSEHPLKLKDPPMRYDGWCFSLRDNSKAAIERGSASHEYSQRERGFVPMIRKGQIERFIAVQLYIQNYIIER